MATIKAFLYALPRSNARRMGLSIKEVEVSVGTKYLTDTSGHKFYKAPVLGDYAIFCHEQYNPEYGSDFVLYCSREDAEARQRGDQLVEAFCRTATKMRMELNNCPIDILEAFVTFSTAIASGDLSSTDGKIAKTRRYDVVFSVYDECTSGDRKIDGLLLKYGAQTHEEALDFVNEAKLNAETLFDEWCCERELDPKQCPYRGAIEIEEFIEQESACKIAFSRITNTIPVD